MANGNRIITSGIAPGRLFLQEGTAFIQADFGFDSGSARWLTHPLTPETSYPQRGARSTHYPGMVITNVTPRWEESGMIELTATYAGLMKPPSAGTIGKERLVMSNDLQYYMKFGAGGVFASVPKPTVTREYVTTDTPTYSGVNESSLLASLPSFGDPVINFSDGTTVTPTGGQWFLEKRSWNEPLTGSGVKAYHVRENYVHVWVIIPAPP